MKTIAILATATIVTAGTNKTLAPTPGVVRPNAPPPITPFPTEPNVVRIVLYNVWCIAIVVWRGVLLQWRVVGSVGDGERQRDGSCK